MRVRRVLLWLTGVAVTSPRNAWAVGYTGRDKVFILRWNGRVWRRVHVRKPTGGVFLNGVAATSARNVWAVGGTLGGFGTGLILHWDGTAWTREPLPALPVGSFLQGVAATSPSRAWAVGSTGDNKTVILRWNGTAWRRAGPDVVGALTGVTTASRRDAWAVGATSFDFASCSGSGARARTPRAGVRLLAAGSRAGMTLALLILERHGLAAGP